MVISYLCLDYTVDAAFYTDGEEIRNKFLHLKTLMDALLPVKGQSPELREEVENLIMDDEPIGLKTLRLFNLKRGNHDHYWHENVTRLNVQFTTGDVGYIPKDKLRQDRKFNDFVKVANVFEGNGSSLKLVTETLGTQYLHIKGTFPGEWTDAYPFLLPDEIEGYVVNAGCILTVDLIMVARILQMDRSYTTKFRAWHQCQTAGTYAICQ